MKTAARNLFYLFLIILVGLIIYFPAFRASFHLDDSPSIRDNAALRHLDLKAIWEFWPTRFFTYLSLALNFRFSGLNPFSYHATNVAIHICNSLLVFFLLRRMTRGGSTIPLIGGMLFLCHPIQTQAVTYVVQRATSLAATFYLLSVLFYLHAVQIKKNNFEKKSDVFPNSQSFNFLPYILSLIFAIGAMLTKEFAITLPFILILLEFTVLRSKAEKNGRKFRRLILFLATLMIIPLCIHFNHDKPCYNDSGQIEWLKKAGVAMEAAPGHGITPRQYLITQPRVFITYLRLVFFPVQQRLEYDENAHYSFTSFLQPLVLMPLFVIVSLPILALAVRKKYALISLGILWFIIVLLPESSFIPILDVAVEHRLYLPLAGAALAFTAWLSATGRFRAGLLTFTTLVIVCFAGLTYRRNLVWRDPITLWEDNVVKAEGKARIHGNLGKAYLDAERFNEAARQFQRMIELDPTFAGAYNNLAVIYIDHLKNYEEAKKYIRASLELFPDYPAGYVNLGVIYLNSHELSPAIENFRKALQLDPENLLAHYNLAACYINRGDLERAEKLLRRGQALWPEDHRFYLLLARIHRERGEIEKAESNLRKAQSLQPAPR